MQNKTYPCLWFDGQAKAAADFYCTIFPDSKILIDSPMVVNWELNGLKFMGLNGGPMFKLNASISMFANFDNLETLNNAWNKLIDGGSAMMPIDKYPWSERYGWLKDKFGLTWQLMLNNNTQIMPAMLFANTQFGKGKSAMELYSTLFPSSGIDVAEMYGEQDPQNAGNLMFGQFHIFDKAIVAMDGPGDHNFQFNEALSFVVECQDQTEIDKYWDGLIADGGSESMCGWLKDKFGVSWQIIPASIGKLMSDPATGNNVMQALMKMRKLDISILEKAAGL
jgi:predicted 3-demethylubiquinone-9 3-methyltransferase (glyoxalase superfamily)